MRTVKASEFKAKCLKLMDEVAETGEPVLITKNGKPVARLTAAEPKRFIGALKDHIIFMGDVVSPIEDLEWSCDEHNL